VNIAQLLKKTLRTLMTGEASMKITGTIRNVIWAIKCCLIAACLGGSAMANDFPSKPMRLVVPVATGGGNDLLSRNIALRLGELYKQAVIVDNRTGAGGSIATEYVVKAPADGYTLLMGGTAQLSVHPILYPIPYSTVNDLAPVTLIAEFPTLVLLSSKIPANSIKEFISFAKANPGKLSYGTSGIASGTHLSTELLKLRSGIDMEHVPYKGAGPALNDLISGRIAFLMNNPLSSIGHARAGRIKAVAVTSTKRLRSMPDIPTVSESGLPGFSATFWLGVLVPKATPEAIVTKLHKDIVAISKSSEVVAWAEKQGMEIEATTPAEFASKIRADMAKWAEVAKAANVKPED
jgi:tripartite-type tricarboxylate transporter receptor subunit TctC